MTDLVIYFLFPFPLCTGALVLGLLLCGTRWRRAGIRLIGLATLVLLVCSTSPASMWLAARLERQYPALLDGPDFAVRTAGVRHVVVLGGMAVDNPRLPITSRLLPSLLARAAEGARIYRLLPGSRVVTSGFGGGATSEARMAAQFLTSLGVDSQHIVLEESSSNTYEEALTMRQLIGDAPFVLVTSALHMPRAVDLFRGAGLRPVPAPTDHLVKRPMGWELAAVVPRVGYFQLFEAALYEHLARMKDRARGR